MCIRDSSGGYVSYANQTGCSNAHIFAYGGKPWLTQYWVRQVKERAYGGITPDKGYGGHDAVSYTHLLPKKYARLAACYACVV